MRASRRAMLGLLLVLGGCSRLPLDVVNHDGDIVSGTGTVHYVSIEGGFFGIVADGVTYDPTNLDGSYQLDGLHVRFRARVLRNAASIHMAGPIVEIEQISID